MMGADSFICLIRTEKRQGAVSFDEEVLSFATKEEATAHGEYVSLMKTPLLSTYSVFKKVAPAKNIYLFALVYLGNEENCLYLSTDKKEVISQVKQVRQSPFFGEDINLVVRAYLLPKERIREDFNRLYKELSQNPPAFEISDPKEDIPYPKRALDAFLKNAVSRPYAAPPTEKIMDEIYKEAQEKASVPPFNEEDDPSYPPSYVCHVKLDGREYVPDPFATSDRGIALGYALYAKEDLERKYPKRKVSAYVEVYRLPVLLPAMSSYCQIESLVTGMPEEIIVP